MDDIIKTCERVVDQRLITYEEMIKFARTLKAVLEQTYDDMGDANELTDRELGFREALQQIGFVARETWAGKETNDDNK